MDKQSKQEAVTVERKDDGAITVYVNTYALSLFASRRDGTDAVVVHEASHAPSGVDSEEAAVEYGLKEAREKWPEEEGWSHDIKAKLTKLTFNFGSLSKRAG
jgi:hypothetical protein